MGRGRLRRREAPKVFGSRPIRYAASMADAVRTFANAASGFVKKSASARTLGSNARLRHHMSCGGHAAGPRPRRGKALRHA
jgi:hypothetical protein